MAIFRRPIDIREINAVESIIHDRFSTDTDTICDHVRVVYKVAIDRVDDLQARKKIMDECKIIMVYAKRMDNKLKQFHDNKDYDL